MIPCYRLQYVIKTTLFGLACGLHLGAISDEHGEMFHQDISMFEKHFSRRWNESMLAVDMNIAGLLSGTHQQMPTRRNSQKVI